MALKLKGSILLNIFLNGNKNKRKNIIICFNELLTKEGLIKNFGFYISNVNIIFGIITVLIFYMKQFVKIKNIINDITYSLKYSEKKKIFKKNKSINITENITENKIDSK